MAPTTEIPGKNDKVVVTFLNLLLADEYVLYTKTRAAHWNVDEANSFEIKVFLENQYNALDIMIDEIAERIPIPWTICFRISEKFSEYCTNMRRQPELSQFTKNFRKSFN